MKKDNVLDMTKGDILKLIVLFAMPILGGNIFQELYNVIDTLIVGKTLGVAKLAAVGSTGSLLFFVIGFVMGLSGGCAVITSQRFGANDIVGVKRSMAAHIVIASIVTVFTTAFFCWQATTCLELLRTNTDIFKDAYTYTIIMFAGLPAPVMYNCLSSSMRSVGDSKTPLIFIIVASIVNITLDLYFIIVCKWDVAGVAWATVIAQTISALLCAIVIWKRTTLLIPRRRDFIHLWPMIRDELKVGVPMGIQFSVIAFGFMVLQYVLNSFGSQAVAAFTVGSRIQSLMNNPLISMAVVMATFVGQNYGAQEWERIGKGVCKCLTFTVLFSMGVGLVVWLLVDPIIHMFIHGEETEVVRLARQFLAWSCPLLWLLSFVFVTRGALQGLGDGVTPMLGGILELIMRVAIPLGFSASLGYTSVCIASPAAWFACGALMTTIFVIRIRRLYKQPPVLEAIQPV